MGWQHLKEMAIDDDSDTFQKSVTALYCPTSIICLWRGLTARGKNAVNSVAVVPTVRFL